MVPLFGPLSTRCRIILRTKQGTIILTTTHESPFEGALRWDPRPTISRHSHLKWEFPKIRDPTIDNKIIGLLLQGHPQKGPPI